MSNRALSGIRVLDLSRVLAGPYCTMVLGDLGAEVIKVEAPGGSDDTRTWGPPFQNEESAYYLSTNRNKRAITLNLQTDDGRTILRQLIKQSDVLIHNFKTGSMEKWGLDYEAIRKEHPHIIYCSISGFGQTGPYKHFPGYDFLIQAMSGFMSITGTEESGPMKVGVAITDVLTGLNANIAIQSALIERQRSGEGQFIDISLFDSAVSSLVNVTSNYLISGQVPGRLGNKHPNIAPYQTFSTQDNPIVIAVGNNHQFYQLCDVMALTELADDERFKDNPSRIEHQVELEQQLTARFIEKPADFWVKVCREAGIPCGPIYSMDQVFNDPHAQERGIAVDMEHPTAGTFQVAASPIGTSKTPVSYRRHPPMVGEHTEEVLTALGYTQEQCNQLRQQNII
ncbi:CaiB/BaiF CoA transferase family protein [Tuberibacillus sp. Marseille-P3662]|uniref:CaiB/BaiF CoA transferase family protein n=1 Tax=Tuberibacillus sp. Marseille-P3662 TaxID=1965358 RepID=UPI003F93DEF6